MELRYIVDFTRGFFEKYNKQLREKVVWEVEDVIKRATEKKSFGRLTQATLGESLYLKEDQCVILQ